MSFWCHYNTKEILKEIRNFFYFFDLFVCLFNCLFVWFVYLPLPGPGEKGKKIRLSIWRAIPNVVRRHGARRIPPHLHNEISQWRRSSRSPIPSLRGITHGTAANITNAERFKQMKRVFAGGGGGAKFAYCCTLYAFSSLNDFRWIDFSLIDSTPPTPRSPTFLPSKITTTAATTATTTVGGGRGQVGAGRRYVIHGMLHSATFLD